jgi:hypothetical protein
MWGRLKFAHKAPDRAKPDHSEPDHAEPNQAPHRQIVMYKQERTEHNWSSTDTIIFFFGTLSIVNGSDDDILWNGSEEDGDVRSECEEDEGTDCKDSDTDW